MRTKIVEATNGNNYGKFLLLQHEKAEWERESIVDREAAGISSSLLRRIGTNEREIWVLDLQTHEGAGFVPSHPGNATFDLEKHRVWVCPLFEHFLAWLYAHPECHADVTTVPDVVAIDWDGVELYGRRRKGPR